MSAVIRAVIFDFDGVILDSNALKTQAFASVFARYPEHAAAMMAYHAEHVSQSRFDKFRVLASRLGRADDEALIERLAGEFAAALEDGMAACPEVPGARPLLDELSARVPLYLASVTPEAELARLLATHRFHGYFQRVFGCPPWTKPDAVAAIAAECGGAQGLVLIGDSAGDQRAAAAHGVEFIARDSGLQFDPPVQGTRELGAIAEQLRPRLPV